MQRLVKFYSGAVEVVFQVTKSFVVGKSIMAKLRLCLNREFNCNPMILKNVCLVIPEYRQKEELVLHNGWHDFVISFQMG